MEPNQIQQIIDQAESDMLQLSDTVAQLKESLSVLIEENNQLKMTNHDLKELLVKRSHQTTEEQEVVPTEEPQGVSGKERLQSFYDDGIHVCHPYFGSRRLPEEECIFCQEILDRLDEVAE